MGFLDKDKKNGGKNKNKGGYEFEWIPAGGDVDVIPRGYIDVARRLLDKGAVSISSQLGDNGMIRLSLDSYCWKDSTADEGKEYAGCSSEFTVSCLRSGAEPYNSRSILISTGFNATSVPTGACHGCNATLCPYVIAARLKYLEDTGAEGKIPSLAFDEGKHPVLHSSEDYGIDLKPKYFTRLSKLSDVIFENAKQLVDDCMVTMADKLFEVNGVNCCKIFLAFDYNEFDKPENSGVPVMDVIKNSRTPSVYVTGVLTIDPTMPEWQQTVIAAALIHAGVMTGRDISVLRNESDGLMEEFIETSRIVGGLDRILKIAENEKTDFLRCTVEGEHERGCRETVAQIAGVLAKNGKIMSNEVFEVSFGQLAREFNELYDAGDQYTTEILSHHKTYAGYYHRTFEKKRMYMVTGLDVLLNDRNSGSDSLDISMINMRWLLSVLGTVEKETYVAIVGYAREINEFLSIDSRFKFLYGSNRLVYPDLTHEQLYKLYLEGLSKEVLDQITDKEKNERKFSDYLSFNARAIPFDNDELAGYLAEYSNIEGKPVLPEGVYNPRRVEEKLSKIIGMKAIKEQIREFENYIAFRKKAEAAGVKLPAGNMHMLFTGNPGTGKTMIARIISTMLYEIGFLPEDKLIEVERKDLVANYLGQTAGKAAKKIEEAMGGVLFIDEAYTLTGDQYASEAVATLLKAMEDHKSEFIVIFAGYVEQMQTFVDSNPGLSSRIGYKIHFDDYTVDELLQMLDLKLRPSGFTLTAEAREKAALVTTYFARRKNFGNGRFIDKLWQETLINHSANCGDGDMMVITEKDIPSVQSMSTRHSSSKKVLKLEDLVGLAQVKEQVRRFRNRVAFETKGREFGIDIPRGNSHMMFLGNAGTGKTTVARILVDELYSAGLIIERKLTEVTAKDLIAEYVGQTSPKTQAVIDRAMGGVLFIDEAYQLAAGSGQNSYGQDAVATLIKAMEDSKDQFVVIFAGYEKEMKDFLGMNTGIASRIGYTFHFDDYDADELVEIFKMKVEGSGLMIGSEEALKKVRGVMQYFQAVPNFGNGRFAEKVANAVYEIHAERCLDEKDPKTLVTVSAEDIPDIEHMIGLMPDDSLIKPSKITESQNIRTAVHELGHALLEVTYFPDAKMDRITIAAEGSGALGYVSNANLLSATNTGSELRHLISVMMAGIASEEVFLGEFSNGGGSDLEKATEIAWRMISDYGMSEKGFAVRNSKDESSQAEINEILGAAFDDAKKVISSKRPQIEKARDFLLEHRTITDAEFRDILGM